MPRGGSNPTVGNPAPYFRRNPDPEGSAFGPFVCTVTAVNANRIDGSVAGDPDAGLGDPYDVVSVPALADASTSENYYDMNAMGL